MQLLIQRFILITLEEKTYSWFRNQLQINSQEDSLGIAGVDLFLRCFACGRLYGQLCTLQSDKSLQTVVLSHLHRAGEASSSKKPIDVHGKLRLAKVGLRLHKKNTNRSREKSRASKLECVGFLTLEFPVSLLGKVILPS